MARLDLANARLGARRARIADAPALRALLARVVAGEVGDEAALREALEHEARIVLGWVEGRRARRLLLAWLSLDEAAAVKAVLRGVSAGEAVDRTLAAVPRHAGIAPAVLRRAASAGTVEMAVSTLAASPSPVAAAAAAALAHAEGEGLVEAEVAADAAAIARARAACRGSGEDDEVVRRALAELTDARNAATLLVLAGAVPAVRPWIPGGRRWDPARLDRLARGGLEGAREAIAAAFRLPVGALATAPGAERALEAAGVGALRREARLRPLSIAVPLAYLAARREEVRRVALVLRCAPIGLDPDELLDLVGA